MHNKMTNKLYKLFQFYLSFSLNTLIINWIKEVNLGHVSMILLVILPFILEFT